MWRISFSECNREVIFQYDNRGTGYCTQLSGHRSLKHTKLWSGVPHRILTTLRLRESGTHCLFRSALSFYLDNLSWNIRKHVWQYGVRFGLLFGCRLWCHIYTSIQIPFHIEMWCHWCCHERGFQLANTFFARIVGIWYLSIFPYRPVFSLVCYSSETTLKNVSGFKTWTWKGYIFDTPPPPPKKKK